MKNAPACRGIFFGRLTLMNGQAAAFFSSTAGAPLR